MVSVIKGHNFFQFKILGWHKIWALKSQLTIPADHILRAYEFTGNNMTWLGLRMPGTYIPGIISAGTYYGTHGKIFCDVCKTSKTIVVDLQKESYKKLYIEVADKTAAIALLNNLSQ